MSDKTPHTKGFLSSLSRQQKQYALLVSVVGGVVLLILGSSWLKSPSKKREAPTEVMQLETVGDSQNKELLWKERTGDDIETLRSEILQLTDTIHTLQKEKGDEEALFAQKLEEIYGEMDKHNAPLAIPYEDEGEELPLVTMQSAEESIPQIQTISLRLSKDSPRKQKPKKSVDNTIPAGAFARAVLLSGIDASTSLSSSNDPRPMLLRITDPGQLPRQFQSDLQDCHCTASAYGDLSSERVFVRLEKMSCTERLTGEIIETEVAGYVTGSDGRAGIRGVIVSKEGPYIARSLMGGILSGISNVANPENQQGLSLTSQGLAQTDPLSSDKLFLSGVGRGTSKAMDRLSDYYISRAEQLQPVIQVPAGQEVDIVFTEGTFMGDSSVKEKLSRTRDQKREQVSSRVAERDPGFVGSFSAPSESMPYTGEF